MDAVGFLESIKKSKRYRKQIVHTERIARKSAVYVDAHSPLGDSIRLALARQGITQLYTHQAESVEAVRNGENIVVVTGTASGKTLCYNVPVIEAIETDPKTRALYIYPTKALAQDQLGKLVQLEIPEVKAAVYDGDTPRTERSFIKTTANMILTNPDMLHFGILPYHTTWANYFRNLKYVVIDEVHMYRGVFGSHVANIIRRLRRIAANYGANPQFLCASATIRNPAELVRGLTGLDARVISNDGSPSGEKVFAFWNPPILEKKGERRSSNSEAVDLLTKLVQSGTRTIVFTKARKTAELILKYARDALIDAKSPYADRVVSYRAGYRPAERREIERRLFSGELMAVATTVALEVGVDIGGLDAALIAGYPGTIASAWQQAGRAGRGEQQSLAVLIAQDDPMDQYLMRNPNYFFGSEHERAIVDPTNPYILSDHLLCAAYELPLRNEEVGELFGDDAFEVIDALSEMGQLSYRSRWFYTGSDYPAKNVNIRSSSNENYDIISIDQGGAILGTVDSGSVFETVHPGAVYLHGGESYVVQKLDIEQHVAFVERTDVSYYTTPGSKTHILVAQCGEEKPIGNVISRFGDVSVTSVVTHYVRKELFTEAVMEKVTLDLPEMALDTEAAWIEIPTNISDKLIGRGFDLPGSLHALEHAAIGIMPLVAMCDRNDIGGVSHPQHPDTQGLAAIFIYDGHSGGVGLARAAYEDIDRLLAATLDAIESCGCDDGCPSCVQSPKCGSGNQPLDKAGAVFLLREILAENQAA